MHYAMQTQVTWIISSIRVFYGISNSFKIIRWEGNLHQRDNSATSTPHTELRSYISH